MTEQVQLTEEELKIHREELISRLKQMEVPHRHNERIENLEAKLKEALQPPQVQDKARIGNSSSIAEMKKYCKELIRVRVQCMNPAKSQFKGEFATSGNDVTGAIRHFVSYNCETGNDQWVPRIIIELLKHRQYTQSSDIPKEQFKSGAMQTRIMVPEFVIAEL